jgi:DNA replication and repair protein RecF
VIIEDLKLIGFRNLKHHEVSFCKNRNLICGVNGAGKTSILEAIFLLAYGKSFLNRKKSEILNHNSDEFFLRLKLSSMKFMKEEANSESEGLNLINTINAHYKDRFVLYLNQKKTTIFEVNNYLYPVFFSSSDYNLYVESKSHTRKIIDRFIFGIDSLYISYLLRYNRVLKQKNFLLKTNRNSVELRSWNKIISELAEKLIGSKMKFIQRLNTEIKNKFAGRLNLVYRPSLNITEGVSSATLFKQIEGLTPSEMMAKRSLAGPHLDNVEIHLNTNPLKLYSSGEKKIHLLMVYISFIELFKKEKNEYPVFLVDDFDTAMDAGNIDFLMKNYPEMQVIATSVNKNINFDKLIELKKEN